MRNTKIEKGTVAISDQAALARSTFLYILILTAALVSPLGAYASGSCLVIFDGFIKLFPGIVLIVFPATFIMSLVAFFWGERKRSGKHPRRNILGSLHYAIASTVALSLSLYV